MIRVGGQRIPFITVVLMITESALITAALWGATLLRFHHTSIWEPFQTTGSIARILLVVVVCEICLYYYDLYDLQVVRRRQVLFIALLQALGVACVLLAILYYASPTLSLGRGVAVVAAPAIAFVILAWRQILESVLPYLRRTERVLVLGTEKTGISLVHELVARPEFNQQVVGFLDEEGRNIGQRLVNPGIIGAASELEEIVEREKVDRVVISLAERRGRTPVRELLHLKFAGVLIEDAHTAFERITGRIMLEHLNPSWLIMSDGFRKSPWLFISKRILDIAVSLVAIVLTAPLMLLAALAIWLESGWPVLFRQTRVGLKGRHFQIIKFRSMYPEDPNAPVSWTKPGDRRITRVGKFLRKNRLDELPQFFNVLRGDMSLVGPRPERPEFCAMLEEKIPYYGQRHSVRPGISGWAQVKFSYGDSIEGAKAKLEYELFYIKHMSLMLDLAILLETVKVMLSGRGAH